MRSSNHKKGDGLKNKIIIFGIVLIVLIGLSLIYIFSPFGQAARVGSCAYKFSIQSNPSQIKDNGVESSKIIVTVTSGKGRKISNVEGLNIYFSTSLGQLSSTQVTTNSAGQAEVTFKSTSAGQAQIVAQNNSCIVSTTIEVVPTIVDGGVLLSDDFATALNLSKWTVVYNGYGTVRTENGSLMMAPMASTQPSETHAPLIVAGSSSWQNYQLTLKMRTAQQLRTGSTPNQWEVGWVFFRYVNAINFYYLIYKPNGVELGKVVNDTQIYLETLESPKMVIGNWDNYKIIVNNNNIKVYINGSQVINYTDNSSPYLTGKIGLYNEDAKVYYDDVVVTSL